MPVLTLHLDKAIPRLFVEVRPARECRLTSASPAPQDAGGRHASWVVDAAANGEMVVALPESDIISSDKTTLTTTSLRYETVGPGERAGFGTSDPCSAQLCPPFRYYAPTYPAVGPPVLTDCAQVPACDLPGFLSKSLTQLRLPGRQRRAMIRFWLPMMQARSHRGYVGGGVREGSPPAMPYVLVRFLPSFEAIEQVVGKVMCLPQPSSVRRVFMVWQAIPEKLSDDDFRLAKRPAPGRRARAEAEQERKRAERTARREAREEGRHYYRRRPTAEEQAAAAARERTADEAQAVEDSHRHGQDLAAIAEASLRVYEQPAWPPPEDPTLTPEQKAESDEYGYVQRPNGMWEYARVVDESQKPAVLDVVEYGGACLNDLEPHVYAREMHKVTRV